ncbi:MAG: cache domain-containing protein, partial [Candidatus Omnitrophica bacterium]|nr:cache domain-containing protein [Candidatus Omnitrophota bacterium]
MRFRIFAGFALIIFFLGAIILFYGRYFIAQNIIGRAQREVTRYLKAAWSEYHHELDRLGLVADFLSRLHAVRISGSSQKVKDIKERYKLDYILIDALAPGEYSRGVITETKLLTSDQLAHISPELASKAVIADRATPMARSTHLGELRDALVMEASVPMGDQSGQVKNLLRVGKMLNRNFDLVDRIQEIIFEKKKFNGKPTGTVTVFLGDRRIATTVLTDTGERAIGTLLSQSVSEKVYGEGVSWNDRAFVVNDWYLTAYEPIRSRNGKVIGILYVGILERPFLQIRQRMFFNLGIILL